MSVSLILRFSTSDGRRDVLENEVSTFVTGAIVMCTV